MSVINTAAKRCYQSQVTKRSASQKPGSARAERTRVSATLFKAAKLSLVVATWLPFESRADDLQRLTQMEHQIHEMQQQLRALRQRHDAEQRQQRRQLETFRHIIESDPERLGPIRAPFAQGGPRQTDSGLESANTLLPPENAATPYGQLTGTPSGRVTSLAGPRHRGQLEISGLRITLGGYVEAASIYRSRNNVADISSNFGTIPFANDPNAHISEFRETARQSRLAALIEGDISEDLRAQGYFETDFQASGSSSNSRLSNSYVLRERVFYGQLIDDARGLTLLAGQNWSLLTMHNHGMRARDEQTPIVIDAQYIPGFAWTRNPQVRIVKSFADARYNLGLSVESPQQVVAVGPGGVYLPPGARSSTFQNNGVGINNPVTEYSTDIAPDIIAKASADPTWGHYEVYGLMRVAHSRVSYDGYGRSKSVLTGGGGGGAIVPLERAHKINVQLSGLVGNGVGRYSSANTPDATLGQDGQIRPLPAVIALAGIYGNLAPSWQVYAYAGTESLLGRRAFTVNGAPYGYGNSRYLTAGCGAEGTPAGTCQASLRQVAQGTTGFWWTYLHGDYGTLKVGAQYSYTVLHAFGGQNGAPSTDAHMVFLSLRYLPFQ